MKDNLQIVKMSDVELQEVDWLWYPYIPFGKISMIQGDPGEGKTTLALRLAAACSTGLGFPGMELGKPINVIYQTAEDGLGDTIKPRLMDAGADQDRVLNIVEDTRSLTLLDERMEAAIVQTGAKLMILDPVQGYLGEKIDMNRANEVRVVMKKVSSVAERTGCAIVLVGHLNKAVGASAAKQDQKDYYRHSSQFRGSVRAGLHGLAALGGLIEDDSEDPDERRKRIEAEQAGSNVGTVLGLAIGTAMALIEAKSTEEQAIQDEQAFNEFLAQMEAEEEEQDFQQSM